MGRGIQEAWVSSSLPWRPYKINVLLPEHLSPDFPRTSGGPRSRTGACESEIPESPSPSLSSSHPFAEIDEDRVANPLLKSTLTMSPRQRKKVTRTTPTMKELQLMVEHHLCQQQDEQEEGAAAGGATAPGGRGKWDPAAVVPDPPGQDAFTDAETRLNPAGTAAKAGPEGPVADLAAPEAGRVEPSTEPPTLYIPPRGDPGGLGPASH
ncbi:protein phosphatase 1 regulatory subunit 1A isoform X2 [Tachyglossus aculeatus]|uniref:protein phosphatase 1 regulatory subunit 1A isoform X2 n=1 Tax=Tachyglossus aculeatus TaxID=9261 RepID=UPI0018F287F2|nr:protein phosphatase 1 regulatory subunit 1A isoform X2 [Tachyglossus aculeatus]